jgi:hypothetical protein
MLSRLVLPAVALLLTVALGFWVSQAGRPYNAVLFNIHKLVALSAVVLTGWAAVRTLQTIGAPLLPAVVLSAAAVAAIALFASGALMSMDKLEYALTFAVHRVTAALLVIVVLLEAYLLARTQ